MAGRPRYRSAPGPLRLSSQSARVLRSPRRAEPAAARVSSAAGARPLAAASGAARGRSPAPPGLRSPQDGLSRRVPSRGGGCREHARPGGDPGTDSVHPARPWPCGDSPPAKGWGAPCGRAPVPPAAAGAPTQPQPPAPLLQPAGALGRDPPALPRVPTRVNYLRLVTSLSPAVPCPPPVTPALLPTL